MAASRDSPHSTSAGEEQRAFASLGALSTSGRNPRVPVISKVHSGWTQGWRGWEIYTTCLLLAIHFIFNFSSMIHLSKYIYIGFPELKKCVCVCVCARMRETDRDGHLWGNSYISWVSDFIFYGIAINELWWDHRNKSGGEDPETGVRHFQFEMPTWNGNAKWIVGYELRFQWGEGNEWRNAFESHQDTDDNFPASLSSILIKKLKCKEAT